jgi:hypothetical protein
MTSSQKLTFTDEAVRLIEIVADRHISSTQSIKTLIIEKNEKRYISLQKWWRESRTDPWREGKGFHFEALEVTGIIEDLKKALILLP